ncbi:MAG: crotonase/enoyl-CoA hydratase family protein [Aeromicrobium sp.]
MTQPRVITEIEGPVARVWLNRPDKLNGLDFDTIDQLTNAAKVLRRNRAIRVVLIEGKGDSFCAGLDFAAAGKESKLRMLRLALPNPLRGTNAFQECFWAWRNLPVPVIAVTRGHVFGGGIQLAMACDFRFSTPDCRWSVLEAKWGLVPDMSGTIPLVELVGADVAKRLTMTGEIISGEQAHAYGLVTGVDAQPEKLAQELIDAIIARSPDSVAATKKLLNLVQRGGVRAALGRERRFQFAMFRTKNATIARKAGMKGETPTFGPRVFK